MAGGGDHARQIDDPRNAKARAIFRLRSASDFPRDTGFQPVLNGVEPAAAMIANAFNQSHQQMIREQPVVYPKVDSNRPKQSLLSTQLATS